MPAIISQKYQWKKITPDDGDYFFGYYDRNPWNNDQSRHLVLHIPRLTRLPEKGEYADIGVVDRQGNYEKLVSTRAWCHQQGSMQLFLKHRPDCFIYNDFDENKGRVVAKIFQLGQGVAGSLDLPVYTISPDGRYGVSLDFSRIPRRGYSYADTPLSPEIQPASLDDDGIWLIDLETGKYRLIVSYRTMLAKHPYAYSTAGARIWLNHAIFNCDSSRLLWLFRQYPVDDPGAKWETFLYTSDLSGSDTACVLSGCQWQNFISHQIWGRTPREILVDADWTGKGHSAVVFDESERPFIAKELSSARGYASHMVFSPDGKKILSDSYLDEEYYQYLLLIDADSGDYEELGRFYHGPVTNVDLRNDLHPRWSPDGRWVTVDSLHDGSRGIYLLDLKA